MAEQPEAPVRGRPRGAPRQPPRRRSFWGKLSFIALVPFVLYTIYAVADKSLQTYRLKHETAVIRAELEAEKRENLLLQQDIANARTDQQVEDSARRYLNLVRSGDTPVVILSSVPRPTPTVRPTPTPVVKDDTPGWLIWLLDRVRL